MKSVRAIECWPVFLEYYEEKYLFIPPFFQPSRQVTTLNNAFQFNRNDTKQRAPREEEKLESMILVMGFGIWYYMCNFKSSK